MLQYLMESCVLFDYMVIHIFQGYYLILNCKKVPWNRKEKKESSDTPSIQAKLISWKYLAIKQVLNFKKLLTEEKNPQTKNHAKRRISVNK